MHGLYHPDQLGVSTSHQAGSPASERKKKRTLSVGFLQSFPHSETKLFLMLQTLSMHLVMMDGRSERGLIPPKMDPFNVLPNASALRLIVASSFAAAPTTTVRPIPYSSLIN